MWRLSRGSSASVPTVIAEGGLISPSGAVLVRSMPDFHVVAVLPGKWWGLAVAVSSVGWQAKRPTRAAVVVIIASLRCRAVWSGGREVVTNWLWISLHTKIACPFLSRTSAAKYVPGPSGTDVVCSRRGFGSLAVERHCKQFEVILSMTLDNPGT